MNIPEYRCPVTLCLNPVGDPLAPCDDCAALFGWHLRPSGREASGEELAAQREHADAKAAKARRHAASPPRLSMEDLAEEAVHLVCRCGFSGEEAAGRLGVSKARLEAAIQWARRAA